MKDEELINIAKKARESSRPIHSNFKVGAALLTKNGEVYTGTNIEDKQFLILGICAERLAIYKALEAGEEEFEKIAIVGGMDKLVKTTPCGICRQFISMHCPNIEVIYLDNDENICKSNINELLPQAFEEEF
jgi:cytidine deaminase